MPIWHWSCQVGTGHAAGDRLPATGVWEGRVVEGRVVEGRLKEGGLVVEGQSCRKQKLGPMLQL